MQEIRVSIIGKTGVGKSALGNALLQHDTFTSQQKTTSVTSECGSGQRILQLNGVDTVLKVVDTPGLMDIGNSNKTIAKEIVKCINLLSPGPHLFLLVFRIDYRLSQEDIKVLEYFKNTFGELIDKYAVVVFTGKDLLDDRSEEDAMCEFRSQLSTFSDVFKHRRFATINNKDTTEGKTKDVDGILQLLQTTIQNNGGDFYKNEMYEEAKILFEERIRDEEEDKQKAMAERDLLNQELEKRIHQEQILKKEREEWAEKIQHWTAEREKLIEDKRNKEIDLDKREMELKQKQKETEILRIQLLERERQSAQWLSSTNTQSYTELPSSSTYQHAFRRNDKRIYDVSDENIVDTISISSSKKPKYEPSRERGKMLQEDEQNIRENFVFLLDNLTDPERLLDRLFSKLVFDIHDVDKIKDEKGKRDVTRELLNRLLNGGSNSYQSFIDSLKEEGYKSVVEQLESNHGKISGYHRNRLMINNMGDRHQLMLEGIDEHYHVSHAGIGDRSEIYKDQGEVDVVKVVVKKSNSTVILSKKKPDHQNIQIKEEILSTCRRNVKNIANCVLYETQESVFSHELEDEHDDTVKTNEVNSRPASQVELDLTVDMIDDQKAGKDDVVSSLVVKQESEDDVVSSLVIQQESEDDVVSSLVIKQEPQDETYGVPEPTLLPLISRQDIVYNDDQDNTTLLTPGHHSSNLESCLQSTSKHQDPESGQPSTSSCLDSSHINQRKDDTTPVKTSPADDDDTTPVKTSPAYDDDKVIRPVDKDTLFKVCEHGTLDELKSLFKVCEHGTLDELKSILSDKTIDINSAYDIYGGGAMNYCIISSIQPVEKMRVLISSGAKLDVKDRYSDSLLHVACENGCVETVELLLKTGRVDIESRDVFDTTPIFNAIRSHKQPVEKLDLLTSSGAKLDVKDEYGDSLLHIACRYCGVETVVYLLNTGRVDIESKNSNGETPILIYSYKQPVEKMRVLANFGAKLDVKDGDGNSLLHKACNYGCVETVELLLNTGRVDIESKNSDGETPILVATLSDVEKVKLLSNFGANLNVKFSNHNVGHWYSRRYDYSGDSLLHYVCRYHKVEDVEFLLSKRIDIEIRNKANETPIISALCSSTQSIQKAELLLDKGAKLDQFSSILHYACQYGSLSCVKHFIKKKDIYIESRDDNNRTPLFSCVLTKRNNFIKKIDLLMSINVNKMGRDKNNLSVLQFARQHALKARVDYLIKNGFTD